VRGVDGTRRERPYVPNDAVLAWVDDLGTWLALQLSERTSWVGRFEPAYKIDPALAAEVLEDVALELTLELVCGHAVEAAIQEVEALGARVLAHVHERGPCGDGACTLVVEIAPALVTQLAWVEGIRVLQRNVESDPTSDAGPIGLADRSAGTRAQGRAGPFAARESAPGAAEEVSIPTTVTLQVAAAWYSASGNLSSSELGRLSSSDNSRFRLHDGEQISIAFDETVPPDVIVSRIRLFVEHHADPGVDPGDIQWKLGHGSLTNPSIVQTTVAPDRDGSSEETLDSWTPTALVPDANDLKIVVENDDRRDDAYLDRIFVEVEYSLPVPPSITSIPNPSGSLGQPYGYDADGTAEASGSAPITWSVVSGPSGFEIDPPTGEVSWTPDSAGSFPITIQALNSAGSAVQDFAVEVIDETPLPPTLLPVNTSRIAYCPPERLAYAPAKPQQKLNVFLPRGTPPPAGWPVVLNTRAGGGQAVLPMPSLSVTGGSTPLYNVVASGVAVVDYGVTSGLFYPPGHPSGRYESFRPADDCAEKEAEWAVQWLKTQTLYPLDTASICLRGSSQGAIISIWAAMGPERARASGSDQVRASTRVKAILALQPPVSVWAFEQDPSLAVRMVAHFEQEDQPGVPATSFGEVAEDLQKDGSIMRFAFETAEARANNEAQPICLIYSEPVKLVDSVPADMTLDAEGFPVLHDTLEQPFIHDSWAGYVFYKRLIDLSPQSAAFHGFFSVFAVRNTTALDPPLDYHTQVFSGGTFSNFANTIAHDWVLVTLGVTPREMPARLSNPDLQDGSSIVQTR
jgi:hypothetical protein